MTAPHQPVLLTAAIDALLCPTVGATRKNHRPTPPATARADGIYVDGTFGRGGHARVLLARLSPRARLFVFDKDPEAIAVATQWAASDPRVTVIHDSFAHMPDALAAHEVAQVHGILLDLGVSSPQLDQAQRGFSFMRDGPLDMRMDTTRGVTAAQWLANASVDTLREVIATYGEERFAFRIAKAIAARRAIRPILTTLDFAQLVADAVPTREKGQHPATRTFQAVRIHLNQELQELGSALAAALNLLAAGARLAVISFHSLEDRTVKQCLARAARPGAALARLPLREAEMPPAIVRLLARIRPDASELAANPRARSAVLRVAERTDAPVSHFAARAFVTTPVVRETR